MNKSTRTLIASVMALGAITAAHADSPIQYGEGYYPADTLQSQPSTLTREAVIADLVAARANGTLPYSGDGYDLAKPMNTESTLTRAEVRAQAIAAARDGTIVSGAL